MPAGSPAFLRRAYAVLARLSPGYPPLRDPFRCITHPFAARRQSCPRAAARLACVKHAASVQSEPGSNSSVQSITSHSIDVGPIPPPNSRSRTGQDLLRRVSTFSSKLSNPSTNSTYSFRYKPSQYQAPKTPAPTPIGCQFFKEQAAFPRARRPRFGQPARSSSKEARLYAAKAPGVNNNHRGNPRDYGAMVSIAQSNSRYTFRVPAAVAAQANERAYARRAPTAASGATSTADSIAAASASGSAGGT